MNREAKIKEVRDRITFEFPKLTFENDRQCGVADIAKAVGYNKSTVSRLLGGKILFDLTNPKHLRITEFILNKNIQVEKAYDALIKILDNNK